jgi:DNA repair protein RecO (recombination protein O)
MIVKTEAIVLKSMKYGETSSIVTLYTRAYGKLSVIAKGARDRRSRFGSALQPTNHVQAVIYKKEGRDLQLISQCDLFRVHRRIPEDMEKLHAAMSVVELAHVVSHSEEENHALFSLLVEVLQAINDADRNAVNLLFLFELRLAGVLGFKPNVATCVQCDAPVDVAGTRTGNMQLRDGGVVCGRCAQNARVHGEAISPRAVRVLQRLQEMGDMEAVTRIALAAATRNEVATALRQHMRRHVEGIDRLRAESVFAAIM